ncbi:hypothetical protein [Permianibacter aggregans]|uniref:Outer membrane lipoprotein-sorting protein n=1 Tax=Permianibacter aggregans TaxID=1510150 RepID=A0A4R6UV40_9GAMM|nr:hypothetical protein [Permianibacter aggregans]QGX39576.1 hypothetical protein E2H98_07895 [Permianibacter aggregans]TDQ49673.1 hypothetical protein EV696_10341 [Permianibacter aggregans]
MLRPTPQRIILGVSVLLLAGVASADGLADLQSALQILQAQEKIQAQVISEFAETRDPDDPKRSGFVRFQLTDDHHGLQVHYDRETLRKLEQERQLRTQNEDADTPTLNALSRLDAIDLNAMVAAAANLQRSLQRAEFISEQPRLVDGKPVRTLRFALPLEAVLQDKKTRGYVSSFDAHLEIDIDERGVPLTLRRQYHGKGRAYLVISIEAYGQQTERFQVINNRLISIHNHSESGWRSTFGDGNTVSQRALTVATDSELAITGVVTP